MEDKSFEWYVLSSLTFILFKVWIEWHLLTLYNRQSIYTQASGFPYILFHLQNQISNYK